MMTNQDHGFLGAGEIYIKITDREDLGFIPLGNATKFAIKNNSDTKQRTSHKKNSYGQVLDSVIIPKPSEVKIDFNTFNVNNFALAHMGSLSKETLNQETITDEIVNGQMGVWLKLAKRPVKASTVKVKLNAGTPVDSKKIEVNEEMGYIFIAEDAAVTKGEKLKVSYETLSREQWLIAAGKTPQIKCALQFDGKNLVTNQPTIVDMPAVTLAANGDFDFLASDFNAVELGGNPEVIDGNDASYYIILKK